MRVAEQPVVQSSEAHRRRIKWGAVQATALLGGERRLEASTYLSDGYGVRLAITSRSAGWQRLGQLAKVWQPSRLKGITVAPGHGTPFLAAGQAFETRPTAREWLALEKTENAAERFVEKRWLLVSCSAERWARNYGVRAASRAPDNA